MIKDLDNILGDRVDTDDLIARFEELESEIDDLQTEIEDAEGNMDEQEDTMDNETSGEGDLSDEGLVALGAFSSSSIDHERAKRELEEKQEELARFEKIKEAFGGEIPEGVNLIADSDFENHAGEHAEDNNLVDRHASWPNTCINWAEAAEDLKTEYTTVEIESTTYHYQE